MKNKWLAFIGIVLLSFGCYLDYTVVNIALPTIQKEFHANLSSLQWIMNIYFLALCILAIFMGRLGDHYGRRKVFYIGVIIFTLASILAGFANNINWLIFGRLLQGIGAAVILPLGPSLLPQSFPESERAKAIAWLGSICGIALALGPVLGGFIVDHWGWQWIFFINIPLTIIGFLFCLPSVKELPRIENLQKTKTDFKSFTQLLFIGGACLVFLAGVLSAVALFFDPLYLQNFLGQSAQFSGLILFIIPTAVFIIALFVDYLIKKLGLIHTILIGLFLGAIGSGLQIFFTSNTSLIYILFSFFILGSLWALGNIVPIIAAQKALGPERASLATATMITCFNLGGSSGLGMATIIYRHFDMTFIQGFLSVMTGMFLFASSLFIIIFAARISKKGLV